MTDPGTPAPAPEDEAKLVEALRRGEGEAYETLVRSHAGRMLAVTRRLLRNEDEAQDAVQDAFISAFRGIDRFQGGARLSTWLHRIAVNAALMRIRSRKRRPEQSIDELLPSFLEDGHLDHPAQPWREGADTLIARDEVRRRVRERIDELPEAHRTVLILRDIEELDTAEVAETLGVSRNAVKTRLHRARQALRTLLDHDLGSEE